MIAALCRAHILLFNVKFDCKRIKIKMISTLASNQRNYANRVCLVAGKAEGL